MSISFLGLGESWICNPRPLQTHDHGCVDPSRSSVMKFVVSLCNNLFNCSSRLSRMFLKVVVVVPSLCVHMSRILNLKLGLQLFVKLLSSVVDLLDLCQYGLGLVDPCYCQLNCRIVLLSYKCIVHTSLCSTTQTCNYTSQSLFEWQSDNLDHNIKVCTRPCHSLFCCKTDFWFPERLTWKRAERTYQYVYDCEFFFNQ